MLIFCFTNYCGYLVDRFDLNRCSFSAIHVPKCISYSVKRTLAELNVD